MYVFNNIIFDLGGVIEKIDPDAVVKSFKEIGIEDAENIFTLFKQSEFCSAFETGDICKDEFIDCINLMSSSKIPTHLIESAWCANQKGVSRETVNTLERLKREGTNLFILSNTNPIHAQKIEEKFLSTHAKSFRSIFNNIYYSFEIHLRKPSEDAYMYLLDHAKLDPRNCVYIDDLATNIDAPQKLGIHCICHRTNDEISNVDLFSEILCSSC